MSNLQPGTTGRDIDSSIEDSPEQRGCDVCGEDPGNCVCGEMPTLQPITRRCFPLSAPEFRGCCDEPLIHLPAPVRIDVFGGCAHPGGRDDDWLRDMIDATFENADMIQIETWSYPDEMDRRADADHDEWSRDFAAELQAGTEDGE